MAQVPAGLQRYEVSFYSGCIQGEGCRTMEPFLSYVVLYAYDPSTECQAKHEITLGKTKAQ